MRSIRTARSNVWTPTATLATKILATTETGRIAIVAAQVAEARHRHRHRPLTQAAQSQSLQMGRPRRSESCRPDDL